MAHRKALSQEMFEHVARQRESGMTVANYVYPSLENHTTISVENHTTLMQG